MPIRQPKFVAKLELKMNALEKSLARSRSVVEQAHTQALQKQSSVGNALVADGGFSFGSMSSSGKNKERYGLFRGWLYAAINALASEAAGQSVHVGTLKDAMPNPDNEERSMRTRKSINGRARWTKHVEEEVEIHTDHPLIDALDRPNSVQHGWQFVYSFVANLNLTGWAYIVGGVNEEGVLEFYSLPTTWVRPDHKEGPFSRFFIQNPKNPNVGDIEPLTRDNVAFAHLPNPSDPMSALAPSQSQIAAIRIDDYIQSSQEKFFDNGIFPSAVVTMGRDPHPEVPGGLRPRLNDAQRRQVIGAIRKTMSGIANYGNPAIIDGMIDSISRLSATQNEMGWEKSEMNIRTRILSAFGVHPYVLGEPVNVGGYAQAAKIEERFCKRVNTFLNMLGTVMTSFAGPMTDIDDRTIVWWEECEPHDPALHWQNVREGRKNGDITRNEFRSMLGLSPDDSDDDRTRGRLLDNPQTMGGAVHILSAAKDKKIPNEAAVWLLSQFFQMSEDEVDAGLELEEPEESPVPPVPPPFPPGPPQPPQQDDQAEQQPPSLEPATEALERAIEVLGISPAAIAERVVEASK